MARVMKGIAVSEGYAIGKVFLKPMEEIHIPEKSSLDPVMEKKRLEAAVEASKRQLETLRDKALTDIGEKEAQVFESHLVLLDDPGFVGEAIFGIEKGNKSAESSVDDMVKMYVDIFSGMKNEYLKERVMDIKDVGTGILKNLMGKPFHDLETLQENTIIVAHNLMPSDVAKLDKSKIAAILTDAGTGTSHSAIMARALEIPAVAGLGDITSCVKNGDLVIVDGSQGLVTLEPEVEMVKGYGAKS